MKLADEDDLLERKRKLQSIGIFLEKTVIRDPYLAPNSQQCIPTVFINQKLYGKATHEDPINNIELVKKMRNIHQSTPWNVSVHRSRHETSTEQIKV